MSKYIGDSISISDDGEVKNNDKLGRVIADVGRQNDLLAMLDGHGFMDGGCLTFATALERVITEHDEWQSHFNPNDEKMEIGVVMDRGVIQHFYLDAGKFKIDADGLHSEEDMLVKMQQAELGFNPVLIKPSEMMPRRTIDELVAISGIECDDLAVDKVSKVLEENIFEFIQDASSGAKQTGSESIMRTEAILDSIIEGEVNEVNSFVSAAKKTVQTAASTAYGSAAGVVMGVAAIGSPDAHSGSGAAIVGIGAGIAASAIAAALAARWIDKKGKSEAEINKSEKKNAKSMTIASMVGVAAGVVGTLASVWVNMPPSISVAAATVLPASASALAYELLNAASKNDQHNVGPTDNEQYKTGSTSSELDNEGFDFTPS